MSFVALTACDPTYRTLSTAETAVAARHRAKAIALDVTFPKLDRYIAGHHLVILLVTFTYYAGIIHSAIGGNSYFVTRNDMSPAMQELSEAAKEAGISVLNKVGMDPIIDHLYAIITIGEVMTKMEMER